MRDIDEDSVRAEAERVRTVTDQLRSEAEQVQSLAAKLAAAADDTAFVSEALAAERQRSALLASVLMELNAGKAVTEVIETALGRVAEAMHGSSGLMLFFEPDGQRLRCIQSMGGKAPTQEIVELASLPNVERAVRQNGAIYIPLEQSGGSEGFWLQYYEAVGALVAPLVIRSSRLGLILIFFDDRTHAPSREDVDFAQLLAGQCSLALDRARAYTDAQKARALFETILQHMPSGVAIAEQPNGKVFLANEQAVRLFGQDFSPQSVDGYDEFKAFHPDGRPYKGADWPLARSLHGEVVINEEIGFVRPDGSCCTVNASSAPIMDAQGRVEAAVIVLQNISDRKDAELERERILAELDATITAIADGIVVYSSTGELMRLNPAAEDMLQYSIEERHLPVQERMTVLRLRDADGNEVPPDQLPGMRALRGETVRNAIFVGRLRDGREMWASVSAAPIRGKGGEMLGAVASFVDITTQQQLLQNRDEFIRVLSHDLRAPLSIVHGHAQILERVLPLHPVPPALDVSARSITTSARRMNAMIQDLVDVARIDAGRLKIEAAPLDIRAFALDLRQRLTAVEGSSRIEVKAPRELPRVVADANQLERILMNLVTNALKYSPSDTPVTVSLYLRDGEVETTVEDRGRGIPQDDLPHIFDRYSRPRSTLEPREGLGLGLYITKGLVEAHGGRVWAESEPGRGSTFHFSLPAAQQAKEASAF